MKILDSSSRDFTKEFLKLTDRLGAVNPRIAKTVSGIVKDVRKNGDKALFKWTKKLDGLSLTVRTVKVSDAEMKSASKKLSPKLQAAIRKAFANIKKFHLKQVEKSWSVKTGSSSVGQIIRPLARVGLYVPGGKASYPTSALMNAIPAMVAGVKEIIICSPASGGKINPAVLYAASLCGITEFYKVGGAQAVAAMAFGTRSIGRVDKIVGPGNAYVAEAKRSVFGTVDIDMIAGPSEICIIADSSANPAWCAADILSQAEHDEAALPILISPSSGFIGKVAKEIEYQLVGLPKRKIAKKCIANRYMTIKARSINEAISLANDIAPEHLQLVFKGAAKKVSDVQNAGAIFVGEYSPEVLGDYMAGSNHVLPTAGSAKFFSPLGVYDFIKRSSLISYSQKDFRAVAKQISILAESEGLAAHARAASIRLKK